jgi:hypothetical protein
LKSKNLAPIVLFVYNRPYHTKQTIEALQKNELANKSELFIYSDAPKNIEAKKSVDEVREYIKGINGFKQVTIIEREKNWGLANSIIDGVTNIVNRYGKIIVLEDDLVTSQYFLKFMNEALEFYKDEENVWSITGFSYPLNISKKYKFSTFLYPRASSKSWAIWKDKWKKVEFDEKKIINLYSLKLIQESTKPYGKDLYNIFIKQLDKKLDSWAIRYVINQILKKGNTVYPICSFVDDIGDNFGTHANNSLKHKVNICNKYIKNFTREYNQLISTKYENYLKFYFLKSRIRAYLLKLGKLVYEK